MSVSVSRSLASVEQGRSTCNVSRSLSVEVFCFAAGVCHVCLLLTRALAFVKQGRSTCNGNRSLSVGLFGFAACVCQCA